MNSDIERPSVKVLEALAEFTTPKAAVFPPDALIARAERLHLAHPHDEGAVGRPLLRRLDD
ncbi:MAG: hypothetical protein ABR603_16765, partial [Pyrinomonadaceae bacterium]